TQCTTPATPTSSSTIAILATADTADMDEDTPTSEPILFPFELTPEQALNLNNLTPEQWIKHCQNVRSNHPWNEPTIDSFLSLPIEKIVAVFHDAVQHLVASSSPPIEPPTPTPTPSTSTSAPPIPVTLPTESVPICPIPFTHEQLCEYSHFTDEEFLALAGREKAVKNWPKGAAWVFYALAVERVAASIKQSVQAQYLPQT